MIKKVNRRKKKKAKPLLSLSINRKHSQWILNILITKSRTTTKVFQKKEQPQRHRIKEEVTW